MSGLFGIFDIGKLSLLANQRALQVISQNLANVNTPGYSRQEAVFQPTEPVNLGGQLLGTGVQIAQVRRIVDSFVEGQINVSQQDLGRLQAQQEAFARLEGIFPDSTEQGINKALSEFFNAFRDVANNPQGQTERTVLLDKAAALSQQFNQAANALTQLRKDLNSQVTQTISEVNDLASQIAVLNGKISLAEAGGQPANDLRDQRGQLLNELGKRIEIHSFEDINGQLQVFVGRGNLLVERNNTFALSGVPVATNGGFVNVFYNNQDITSFIGNGALNGLISLRDTTVAGVLNQMDTLAASLVNEVNQLHVTGYGLDGSTGNNFFLPLTVTAAADSANTGSATIGSGTISANSLLTMHDYEIRFSSPVAYSIVDTTTGATIKGNYTGTAITAPSSAAPLNIVTGTNDTLTVSVDGVASGAITLTGAASPGQAYTSGDALATEIQTQINADATLVAAGKSVVVTYDTTSNRFVITSNSGAANSAVDVTGGTARATLGLAAGVSTAASGTYASPTTFNFDGVSVQVTGAPAANDVFTVNTRKDTAKNIATAITDPRKVAAAMAQVGLPLDNSNALAIAAIQNASLAALGNADLNTYYSTMASIVGGRAQSNDQALRAQEVIQNQLDDLRGQASGVSTDEELTNMLKFERSYQAAARLVTVADELLQTLLAMK
jgi:flagellar hook-associated protein 1 FlgK